MRKALTLVIMIIIIVALSLVLGFVIGHVYQKRFSSQDNMMVKEMCKLQIYESDDRNKIDSIQAVMEKFDYKTIITKHRVDGKTKYCLSLVDSYTVMEANKIIDKIKDQFQFLEDENFHTFRVEEKVKQEVEVAKKEQTDPVKTVKNVASEVNAEDKLYEIQLVSDVLMSTVETLQFKVESKGYKTSISKAKINGSEIYKLRLEEKFTRNAGKKVISKLQKVFPAVKGIWLADVDPEAVVMPHDPDLPLRDVVVSKQAKEPSSTAGNIQSGGFEIQLLASQDYAKVTNLQDRLKKYKYETKITSTFVKGSKYYRLRLKDSYDSESVKIVENRIKSEVPFIKSCWVVKADLSAEVVNSTPKKVAPKKKTEPVVKKARENKYPYSIVCKRDNINIRKGPGTNYAVDNIGRLMKGIEIYVQSEKDGWIEFTLIPEDSKWSGWALKELISTRK